MLEYDSLVQLVQAQKFEQAANFCLQMLGSETTNRFWKTQLGYVYFLNEENVDAHYHKAIATFESLVQEDATDVNALFWLGYLNNIVLNDLEQASYWVQQALSLDEYHPYANLTLAGLTLNNNLNETLLRRVIAVQPRNIRVIVQLCKYLVAENKLDEAKIIYQLLLSNPPYYEENYGVLNDYINEVLTSASHAPQLISEMSSLLIIRE
jgi:tetratricopeptide (TPR) repeat protein